jgi:hypothetical protein
MLNWCCCYFLSEKEIVKRFVQCHIYTYAQSPPGRHPNDKYPVTLRTAPDLCKNVSLAVLFGSNGNSYTVSDQTDVRIYTHTHHSIQTLAGKKKY